MAKKEVFLWVILFCFHASVVEAVPHIRSISFEGNHVTQESLLLREMYVKEGDELNEELIEKSVQSIMDLGLFESVSFYLAEDYTSGRQDNDAVDLVIILVEKYYFFIVPRMRVDEEEVHLGIQLRWDNIFGLNHNLRFLVEDRGSTAGVEEKRQRIRYYYPNVYGSRYALGFQVLNVNDVDESDTNGVINRKDKLFGVNVLKWLNEAGRNRGWFTGAGVDFRYRENEVVSGSLTSEELDALVLKLRYGFKDVHEYTYNRGGKEFGYEIEISDDALGSDSEFVNHLLFYRSYYRFKSRPNVNLNVQTLLGHSTEDILGDTAYTLGSSKDLRGYDNSSFEGNTLLLVNMEYLVPRKTYPSLRYAYFMDIGNTYEEFRDIKDGDLKLGIGFGFRWKIPKFVKLDLRVDFGYGVSEDDYHVAVGTRHTF